MKSQLLVLAALVALSGTAAAADQCAADDSAIKACVKQYLIDTNILIAGVLSDPGGTKTKEATLFCQLDCATKRSEFDKKYREKK